ncbi:MAG: hypothetical protein ACYDCN_03685 [Bacteroidia bacterium]
MITISINAQVIKQGGRHQSVDNVTDDAYYTPYHKDEKTLEFTKRSLIQINIFQFVFTNIALSYEIFSKDGKSGFHIPFTFGIGGRPNQNPYGSNYGSSTTLVIASQNRIFESGLHYHYYLLGQRRVSPFLGLGFNVGAFNYWTYSTYSYPPNMGNAQIGTNYSGALLGGVLFNPNETITFSLKAGLGFMRHSTDIANYTEYTTPYGLFEVNLGFKF